MSTLAALRQAGAAQLDPLQLHYLERLTLRTQSAEGDLQRLLQDRLTQAVQTLQQRCEAAQAQAQRMPVDAVGATGTAPAPAPLRALLHYLAAQSATPAAPGSAAQTAAPGGARDELKSVRQFRNTWSKLSADRQLKQAFGQAPKNAGPINSHMLVLRSLALMRDHAPDYLNRFMAYADGLLCLDAIEHNAAAPTKPAPQGDSALKPRARAGRKGPGPRKAENPGTRAHPQGVNQ